jgi:hypothetical protein
MWQLFKNSSQRMNFRQTAKFCFPQTEENDMPIFQQDGAPGLKVLITILNVQFPGH